MPVAKDISGNNAPAFAKVWDGALGVTGAPRPSRLAPRSIQKNFIAYIEVFEQTAHDTALHALCKQRGGTPRRPRGGNAAAPAQGPGPAGQQRGDRAGLL